MRAYDVSFDDPSMNLACDEALLNAAEAGLAGPALRFWESPRYFVVLGISKSAPGEVNLDACRRDGVAVTRRCSAGGCVLQGPGCLNYALILDMDEDPELRTIRASYCRILKALRDAFQSLGVEAALEGISDLAISGRKFSGNAQRRKKRFLLHHGTVLCGMDLERIPVYLNEPGERPEYRGQRKHGQFVQNIGVDRTRVIGTISEAFAVAEVWKQVDVAVTRESERLVCEKYSSDAWVYRR